MTEIWLPVPSNPVYEVSDRGRVRSTDTVVWGGERAGWCRRKGRILKPGIASNGYPTIVLGRKIGTRTVHSLVAEAFLGPPPPGMEVRHKDGCRTNPRLENLEYGTRLDNINDAMAHGTRGPELYREVGRKATETKDRRYGSAWREKPSCKTSYRKEVAQ